MTEEPVALCDDARMQSILDTAEADTQGGVALINEALADFPSDPRLHFLRGSLLVETKRFIDAHAAMSKAVEIAPGFEIARFQLGFFELTSGDVDAAKATWEPLKALPENHWMHLFVTGLEHLVADRFGECIVALRDGMKANIENPPLNADMQLIVDKCAEIMGGTDASSSASDDGGDDVSATSLLLGSRRR